MTSKTNIHIFAITMLLLLGACSAGLNEDQQIIADACVLEGKAKEVCRCIAKNLSQKLSEETFLRVVEFNRTALKAQQADAEETEELGLKLMDSIFGMAVDSDLADLERDMTVRTQVTIDCSK